jgi:multidrug efflux pump subunit AcrA (membrane-fusion protein)
MFVQVRVHVDSPHAIVSIPEEARRPNGEVWVIRDGHLDIIRPKAVQTIGGRAVFESGPSGLAAGDRVVTSQISHPRTGMPVAELDPPPAATTEEGNDT